jgi:ABC-type antimicrobial peptide transport system permease subunit
MNLLRIATTALRALRRNVGRTLLTMLGIVIGIAAVIAMMEIGEGASVSLKKSISSMGANNIMIMPGASRASGVSAGMGSSVTLTAQDCEALLRECPELRHGAPVVRANAQIIYGNRNWTPTSITGTTPAYLDVREWQTMAEGEAFTDRDVRSANRVCMVGQTVKRELFLGESPIGRQIRIGNVTLRVIGVLSAKGSAAMGQDMDDTVIAPWTTLKSRLSNKGSAGKSTSASNSALSDEVNSLSDLYPSDAVELYPQPSATQQADTPLPVRFANIDQIQVAARSADNIPQVIDQITLILRARHRLRINQDDDFRIMNMTELNNMLSSTTTMMTNLLLFVALISLVVGGVGIMNIMFVSVTERTREIGLRLAIGARGGDILQQFLVESIILCLAGALVGIALGQGISMIVASIAGWPTALSINAIVLSVLVATSIGVVFGFYPAWRASRLNPIEALRYE